MGRLASRAKFLGDNEIANDIAFDYINNYLLTLKDSDLYMKEHVIFMEEYLSTKQRFFGLFYNNRARIDKVMGEEGYAKKAVDHAIYREAILPKLRLADEHKKDPDWNGISRFIKVKYNADYANRNILVAQLRWYEYKRNWLAYSSVVCEWVKQYREK